MTPEKPDDIDPDIWESMRPEQREIAVHIDGEYRRYYLRGMLAEFNVKQRPEYRADVAPAVTPNDPRCTASAG